MAETVRVVVDARAEDNAPAEPVKAAVEAVAEREDIDVILTGRQDVIENELSKFQNYPKGKNPDREYHRGDRDSRASGSGNP